MILSARENLQTILDLTCFEVGGWNNLFD